MNVYKGTQYDDADWINLIYFKDFWDPSSGKRGKSLCWSNKPDVKDVRIN